MTSVPLVSVYVPEDSNKILDTKISLPAVFLAPIRLDVVQFVHANLSKNRRQAHGVDNRAGHKHAAESWGTGRAVARIPRVSGSGTHRAGQAAFGNMCRKGRMFAPLKTYRRWHRKVNVKQRRHAAAAALAASSITPLVFARGHKCENVPQLPLVVDDKIENYEKTKEAVEFLKQFGLYDDVEKVEKTRKLRCGKGKMRNRRYRTRKGPLIIYSNTNAKLTKAFRNIPGVEVCNVNRLNLKQLAPGGQLGRLIVWTKGAFKALDGLFGTFRKSAEGKTGYALNRPMMQNADLARIINSNEIQEVVRPAKQSVVIHEVQKKNPLKNQKMMNRLNPYASLAKELARTANEEAKKRRQEALQANRGISKSLTKEQKAAKKERRKASKAFMQNIQQHIQDEDDNDRKADENFKALIRGDLDRQANEEEQD